MLFRHRCVTPILTRSIRTSSSQHSKRAIYTHTVAGVGGGLVVITAGYAYYHFSGIKSVVDSTTQMHIYFEEAKQSVAKHHPNEALNHIRQFTKSYAALIPFSGYFLDRLFDSVEQSVKQHGEEATAILDKALKEIDGVMKMRGELTNGEFAEKLFAITRKHLGEIGNLGAKASGPLLKPLTDSLPDTTYLTKKAEQSVDMLKGFFGKRKD